MSENLVQATPKPKPKLLFFFDPKDGKARRLEGFLAQTLQRGRNHDTFQIYRIDIHAHPELVARFQIEQTPSICVVDNRRLALRAYRPRSTRELNRLLAPWLRGTHARRQADKSSSERTISK